jgi:hypothetical protein
MPGREPPWYRQPWPWFLLLLPGVVVVASFATLFIALDNPHSLVRDDWYKDGLAINRQLAQHEYARAHAIRATLTLDSATRQLEVRLVAPEAPASLLLSFVHPTDATLDVDVDLQLLGEGRYAAPLPAPLEGRRYLRLEAQGGAGAWRLDGVLESPPPARVELQPDPR